MVRTTLSAVVLVLSLGLSAALAAGDPPTFSVESLAPKADDMKDGWALVEGGAAADQPCAATLMEIATGVGLDDMAFYVEARRLKTPAGATVDVAWVDIDTDPTTVRKAIDQAAGERGWAVRELSTPYRLLVVGGSGQAQESALRHQQEHVIRRFVTMAETRLEARARHADDMREAEAAARSFLERGRAVGVDAAALDVLDAFLHWRAWSVANGEKQSQEAKLKKDANDEKAKEAAAKAKATADAEEAQFLQLASKGFAPGRAVQPLGWLPVSVAGRAGGMLLEKKDASVLTEAVRLLDAAVAVEGRSPNADLAYANRYNLACAHARLGNLDKAFEYLEGALELGATRPPFAFGSSFVHLRDKDDDMAPLRKDERWEPLIEKYHSDGIKKYEEFVKKQAEKDKGRTNPHDEKPSGDEPSDDAPGDDEPGDEDGN
jgi:tetratricopeptide (TPR) repeat protein